MSALCLQKSSRWNHNLGAKMLPLVLILSCSCVGAQHVINPAEFPETTDLMMDLFGVVGESTALGSCVKKVATPLDEAIQFAKDVAEIDDKMKKIEQRVEVTVGIMEAVMMIPYVGQAASVVLEPAVTVLNSINSGVSKVEPIVGKFAGMLHTWTDPLKTVKEKIEWAEKIISNFTTVVFLVDAKAGAAEACADALPKGRSEAIRILEAVSSKLDVFPEGFGKVLGTVNKGCSKLENVLSKLHLLSRRRGIARLSKIKHVLDIILDAFGPLGHFLDKVDNILHKKFCLLHSLGKLVEEVGEKVIDGAEHLLKGAEHLGKEVLKGAQHLVDEAGHVWIEVEEGAEHVLHEVGHGLEHAGKEIAKGAEHVGKEIAKGAEHVGKEVAKGAEHVAHEVVKGAEHVGKEVAKGAEHVAHEVSKGVQHVGHEISHAFHHAGHVLHHVFGRRNAAEKYYIIDGRLYVLVDGNVDTRSRRGFDVCIRVSDILKGVNYVTGGLMSKAQSLIDAIFHGKSPFHIPGLSSEVLNIGSLFHNLDFKSLLPSIKDFLKIPKLDMEKILKLNLKLFELMLPQCAMAFAKIDMGF